MVERVGGEWDRLPEKEEYGRLIRLTKPIYPTCRAIPNTVKPGNSIKIEATGFIPNRTANVFFNHEQFGSKRIDRQGNVTLQIQAPQDAKDGPNLLVIAEAKKALTAHCAVMILREPVDKNPPAVQ